MSAKLEGKAVALSLLVGRNCRNEIASQRLALANYNWISTMFETPD